MLSTNLCQVHNNQTNLIPFPDSGAGIREGADQPSRQPAAETTSPVSDPENEPDGEPAPTAPIGQPGVTASPEIAEQAPAGLCLPGPNTSATSPLAQQVPEGRNEIIHHTRILIAGDQPDGLDAPRFPMEVVKEKC